MHRRPTGLLLLVLVFAGAAASAGDEWTFTGSMNVLRSGHTATLLPSGKVLVVGGQSSADTHLASAELYDPTTGTWEATGSLTTARSGHTATLLPSGEVLVAGGSNATYPNYNYLASAELYDPASGTWAQVGSLYKRRAEHTATLLPSGKVLVAGGFYIRRAGFGLRIYYPTQAELYNPSTGSWTSTGSFSTPRSHHATTLLTNGNVVISGGVNRSGIWAEEISQNSAEIYNMSTGTWLWTRSLRTARSRHSATLLPSGEILVAGGNSSGSALASTELYNPATGTWRSAASLKTARYSHTATRLWSGKILVAGGDNGDYPRNAELYDAAGTWTSTGNLNTGRSEHTATLLADGRVIVVGGYNGTFLASAEIYDPQPKMKHTATLLSSGEVLVLGEGIPDTTGSSARLCNPAIGQTTTISDMTSERRAHTATWLTSRQVLVVGGYNGAHLTAAELYDPATRLWTPTDSLDVARSHHTATRLRDGRVLVVAGSNGASVLEDVEIYDPVSGTWVTTGSLATGRIHHTTILLADGRVLVAGGFDGDHLASAELYDPATGQWTPTGTLNIARSQHTATLLPSGEVVVAGGIDGSGSTTAELYDPRTETWQTIGPLTDGRRLHAAMLLPSGKVAVVGGYDGDSGELASIETYEPRTRLWETEVRDLIESRREHTVTLLPSGKALVVGGYDGTSASPAPIEIVTLHAGRWRDVTASDQADLRGSTATLLPAGQTLIVGAAGGSLYDPTGSTWIATGGPLANRRFHTATLLPSGNVVVAGGVDPTVPAIFRLEAELYTPASDGGAGDWRATGDEMLTPRQEHTATLLASGRVLVAGGADPDFHTSAELYDPGAETWLQAAPLITPRSRHTAVRLVSGEVLVAGGDFNTSTILSAAEIYDPIAGTWRPTAALNEARRRHAAVLLPSGRVLVTGGEGAMGPLFSTEIYDPATATWTPRDDAGISAVEAVLLPDGQVLAVDRAGRAEIHDPAGILWKEAGEAGVLAATATLLARDEVLVMGEDGRAAVYEPAAVPESRRPVVTSVIFESGIPRLTVTGSGFLGDSEASSGTTQSSPVNQAMIRARPLDNSESVVLLPDPWLAEGVLHISDLPLLPGPQLLTIVTAGVPSRPHLFEAECFLVVTSPPQDKVVTEGTPATFTVGALGARFYQWQKYEPTSPDADEDGFVNIAGAVRASYTTPPIQYSDSGTQYRVAVSSACDREIVGPFTLRTEDSEPPSATVTSPSGGEYWRLSRPDGGPRSETIRWSMADNFHICRVEVRLLVSTDGGTEYQPVPAGGGLPAVFGPGGECSGDEVVTANRMSYTMPVDPPSGAPGSLYKIEVAVTDQSDWTTTTQSPNAFFMVQGGVSSVKTLILANVPRMVDTMGISEAQADQLRSRLDELAGHPRVQGLVVDLDSHAALLPLYQAWDAEPARYDLANQLLFDDSFGIHKIVRDLLKVYTEIRYIVLVGDDRIIPFARLEDRTVLLSEDAYPDGLDLTPDGTTVGQAVAADRYLSDDLLAVRGRVRPDQLDPGQGFPGYHRVWLPDLAIGRLVETPKEIGKSIAVFISQDGVLDLTTLDPATGHKVLVTGYDFLKDSARKIRRKWRRALGMSGDYDGSLAPVDGQLIGGGWTEADLRDHLAGNGGDRYAVVSLNGHASHFEAGHPGTDPFDIRGLDADQIATLDLAGSIIYAVGCHGGLSVPDPTAGDADHPFDLAQAFLGRGVQAYVANTGYGWGLHEGVGYGEFLVKIMTEQLTLRGAVAVGDAVRRAKRYYYLEQHWVDSWDAKTLMQWTFFGLPMYAVDTGGSQEGTKDYGPVKVLTVPVREKEALPPYLTRLDLSFDFSAPGVFSLYDAAGEEVDPATCANSQGCYYTLSGDAERATGETDQPLRPYFVYDSRLSGTSQHGVLWKGGTYREESGWRPIFGELHSNGGDFSDHGTLASHLIGAPVVQRVSPTEGDGCAPSDLEHNSIVVPAEELITTADDYVERLYLGIDLEVLYFNNTAVPAENCDREGPTLQPGFGGGYHEVHGATVDWRVIASDPAEVWRVLVVYTVGADENGEGRWQPLELERSASEPSLWHGSLTTAASQISYVVQAADTGGNVSWSIDPASQNAASGVEHPTPLVVDETLSGLPKADLAVSVTADPAWIAPGETLTYDVAVTNLGPDTATAVEVVDRLPSGVMLQSVGGAGWTCGTSGDDVVCSRDVLAVGPAPEIVIRVEAPPAGSLVNGVTVSAAEEDPEPNNNAATVTTVVTPIADLWVSLSADPAGAGEVVGLTITAGNRGPSAVSGATVSDDFPPTLLDVAWTCSATPGSSCSPSGTGDVLDRIDLAAGGMAFYLVTARIADDATVVSDTVRVDAPVDGPLDVAIADNSASWTLVLGESSIFSDDFEWGDLTAWSSSVEGATALPRVARLRSPGPGETLPLSRAAGAPAAGTPAAGKWTDANPMSAARERHTATRLASGKILVVGGLGGGLPVASAEVFDPATGTWTATGTLATARHDHTATLLDDGRVLVAGGWNGAWLASAELYDPGSGTWQPAAALGTGRRWHTATLLASGEVLVAGGWNGGYLASAELYDPGSGTWQGTNPLNTGRRWHTATLLADGRVLAAGGDDGDASGYQSASAEIYDPLTGIWSPTGFLSTGRSLHTAIRVGRGEVLVVGGFSGTATLQDGELYDPASGTWRSAGFLASAHESHTATLLHDGRVLVVGGYDFPYTLSVVEVFTPPVTSGGSGSWQVAGTLSTARALHTATLLQDGRVLVAGGYGGGAGVEIFEPGASSWARPRPPAAARGDHTATLLADGRVLLTGGDDASTAEIYEPSTGTWHPTASPSGGRRSHTATLLPTGEVLVVGGEDSPADSELFDPRADLGAGAWRSAGTLSMGHVGHTATRLPDGRVLVVGGDDAGGEPSNVVEIYDGSWTAAAPLSAARRGHTATLLADGRVLVVGGWNVAALATTELYDPSTDTWTEKTPLGTARFAHSATLLADGRVLVAGGANDAGTLAGVELYDPATDSWTALPSLRIARSDHLATLLPNGRVLVAGGRNGDDPVAGAEVFDPVAGSWREVSPLTTARWSATATLLASGEVLVAGGYGVFGSLADAELFTVDGGRWRGTTAAGTGDFSGATGIALPYDGVPSVRVLLVGGSSYPRLFNTTSEVWSIRSWLSGCRESRAFHTATLLADGRVLVVGGDNDVEQPSPTAYLHDRRGRCLPEQTLAVPRRRHTATLLPNGKVLIAGGEDGNDALPSAEIYDPMSASPWTPTGFLLSARRRHTATLLDDGRVLVTGGDDGSSAPPAGSEIYDPATGTWTAAANLNFPRQDHTATLLPGGRVLVVGGFNGGTALASAEIYDPGADTWTATGWLTAARGGHTATLLADGRVLVAGGIGGGKGAEIYHPALGNWETAGGTSLEAVTATLLDDGRVLLVGRDGQAELYEPPAVAESRRPVVSPFAGPVGAGSPFAVTGTGFRGDSEAGGGGTQSSASNHAVFHIRPLDNREDIVLVADPLPAWGDDPLTLEVSDLPLLSGFHLVTAFVNGVPSRSQIVEVECRLDITAPPADQTVARGESATFVVEALGARTYQWQKSSADGVFVDVPGAKESIYTTPAVEFADSGTQYRVVVSNGCKELTATATLRVEDREAPTVAVISPAGGEYWLLSDDAAAPRTEGILWAMADDVRICRVEVALLWSDDGGSDTYQEIASNNLPAVFGPGGECAAVDEVTAESFSYAVPVEPPTGTPGSLYKIEVRVTDVGGSTTVEASPEPFLIVKPGTTSFKTLILTHLPRMVAQMAITSEQQETLAARIRVLADHPRVDGYVVELDKVLGLDVHYNTWDASLGDPVLANRVLFAADGIHATVRDLIAGFTGVEHIVIVGDDRIIPMARLVDDTRLKESVYVTGADARLSGDGTVGRALASDRYLSDDPLAVNGPILPEDLDADGHFLLPDLAIGRLVEKPEEIIKVIDVFLGQNGVLDLSRVDAVEGHKVQVAAYDFLTDVGQRVCERWWQALALPEPACEETSSAPIDAGLLAPSWDQADLRLHLGGNGGLRYGVMILGEHGTHDQVGVPGPDVHTIVGLDASEIYGADGCGTSSSGALGLEGGVVLSAGSHGGLPVPGDCAIPDHTLDLPQAFLGRGVPAYVANSGYVWGLRYGIGYGERLLAILAEEMTSRATVEVGAAVRRAKERYYLESPRLDPYDEKSLLQWAFFGLPMYTVMTGVVEEPPAGPVRVERQAPDDGLASGLPPYLKRLYLHFDFTADGVYTKRGAGGEVLVDDGSGCDVEDGCYYTLNGLGGTASGDTDEPIQPYFVYDSKLSDTSQHGVLWKGGIYEEQQGWRPVIAELISNGGDFSNHGETPRHRVRMHVGQRKMPTGEEDVCLAHDEELNTIVVPAEELLDPDPETGLHRTQRRTREVDLEVFYFNNTEDATANCDREGPTFSSGIFGGDHHQVDGLTLRWEIGASDPSGVWRLLVVYNTGTSPVTGEGRWQPLDLAMVSDDGVTSRWQGSLSLVGISKITYVVQAVDRRGNVSWLEYVNVSPPPASGVPHSDPDVVEVAIEDGIPEADLGVTVAAAPDAVGSRETVTYTVAVQNYGPDAAIAVRVVDTLPTAATFQGTAASTSWLCGESGGVVTCTRDTLESGGTSEIRILVEAPDGGSLENRVRVSADSVDPEPVNDSAELTTAIYATADLWVELLALTDAPVCGEPLAYMLAAGNHGPHEVTGATVSGVFSPGLADVSWSCSPISSCAASGSGDVADTVTLKAGENVLYVIEGEVRECGWLSHEASVSSVPPPWDLWLGNNAATLSQYVPDPVFGDGFESGDLSAWSSATRQQP